MITGCRSRRSSTAFERSAATTPNDSNVPWQPAAPTPGGSSRARYRGSVPPGLVRPRLACRREPGRPGSSKASCRSSANSGAMPSCCWSSKTCTGRTGRPASSSDTSSTCLRDERVCLVLTYRSDDLHRRHPLAPVLVDIARSPRVETMSLDRLGLDDTGALVRAISGQDPDPDLVSRRLRAVGW